MKIVNSGRYDDVLKKYLDAQMHRPPVKDISDARAGEIFQKIIESSKSGQEKKRKQPWQKYGAAVAAVFVLALGVTFFFNQRASQSNLSPTEVILPGTDKATLTLGDGSEVVLDSTSGGVIAQQGNNQVTSTYGSLKYLKGTRDTTSNEEVVYNTVTTPRGGQYSLTLPDGTRVWLNAASSLRYPVTSTNEKRVVELTGEAYFEVATAYRPNGKEKLPFIVSVQGVEVEVLGTHFNIMAYGEEPVLQTTLLEGSVRVTGEENSLLLEPGQQAVVPKEGMLYLSKNVDLKEVMAWKDGYFRFNGTSLATIMNQLGRWYDFTTTYNDETLKELDFGGIISRKDNIREMLDLMALTGAVHFEVKGRNVIVKAGQKEGKK